MRLSENAARDQHDESPYGTGLGRFRALSLRVPLVVAVLTALLAAVIGALIPPTYTAESRVAVESAVHPTPHAMAGFPVMTRGAAETYARLINQSRSSIGASDNVALEAIPLPESNVLRLQAHARTPEAAIAGAARAADAIINRVNRVPSIEQQVADRAKTAGDAYADRALTGVQTRAAREAEVQLNKVRQQLIQEASRPTPQLRLIREAGPPVSDRVERAQTFAIIGFLLGFIGAVTLIPTQRQEARTALRAAWRSGTSHTR